MDKNKDGVIELVEFKSLFENSEKKENKEEKLL